MREEGVTRSQKLLQISYALHWDLLMHNVVRKQDLPPLQGLDHTGKLVHNKDLTKAFQTSKFLHPEEV
jgi:hypothetical protein